MQKDMFIVFQSDVEPCYGRSTLNTNLPRPFVHAENQKALVTRQTGKYLTGEAATFDEGDFDADGVFDQLDLVAALRTGNYLK